MVSSTPAPKLKGGGEDMHGDWLRGRCKKRLRMQGRIGQCGSLLPDMRDSIIARGIRQSKIKIQTGG